MKHLKKFEGLEESKEESLENKIRDIIQFGVEIRDVPYGDGDTELDPSSMDDTSKEIIKLLKKEGLI